MLTANEREWTRINFRCEPGSEISGFCRWASSPSNIDRASQLKFSSRNTVVMLGRLRSTRRVSFRNALLLGLSVACLLVSVTTAEVSPDAPRERILLNDGWRFALGHATDREADFSHATGYFSYLAKTGYGDGPAHPAYDDRWWREVDLPHDWAVELPFDPEGSHSHGYKAIGPGFPESSVGWYRRRFEVPESDLGRRIRVEFDGIYRDAKVFVNGFFVGGEPSGYLSQSYDLSEYLNYGGKNILVVRVDASMEEGWFYEGAGIYRHAWLLKTDPLHVARDGTYVTTEESDEGARVNVETTVKNEHRQPRTFTREQIVIDPDGEIVAQSQGGPETIAAGATAVFNDRLLVNDPRRWDLDTPHLYQLVTALRDDAGTVVDRYETTFGIREIRFDPDHGFFLNGRHIKLKGTNNHQDHAGVGTALPDALEAYRIRRLKAMGSNAYRVGHHPASPALLEACDRLGMLVIAENRLMGVNDYHLGQLERMIRRDRNHPSVILWSIGNEEWAIEGNVKGARITRVMQDFVHRFEPTRPVVAAISGGWGGISEVVEVMGVNYIQHGDTDQQHAEFPEQIIVGTEETTTQATRGIYVENAAKAHLPPLDDGSSGGNIESGWRHYAERDYAAGVFFWTGFDYRGEPTPYAWPGVLSQFGIMDTCGFAKDSFHYLRAWWTDEPVIHLFPHWNWPGRRGETIDVRVHSNAGAVELFLNGKSLGRQSVVPHHHLSWKVKYEPGQLEARGYWPDGSVRTDTVATTEQPAAITLEADRASIQADGRDVSVVTVQVRDTDGRIVPTADDLVHFSIEGPGRIIGVGNGNPSSHEPDRFVESVRAIELGAWNSPPAAETEKPVIFEAEFDRPELANGETLKLLLAAIGRNQTATLNGGLLYRDADRATARAEFPLDPDDLRPTGNILRLEALPFTDWGAREDIARNPPALFGVHTSAESYRRKVFNGLAQVLVQSTGESGKIRLKATAEGLEPTVLTIEAGQ